MLYDRNKPPQNGDGVMAIGRIIGFFIILPYIFLSTCS